MQFSLGMACARMELYGRAEAAFSAALEQQSRVEAARRKIRIAVALGSAEPAARCALYDLMVSSCAAVANRC